jgi:hypothetical protein
MATSVKDESGTVVHAVSGEAILAQFHQMLALVPDAEDDDGTGIILDILQATSWEGVNTEGSMPDAEKMLHKEVKVLQISKRESTIEESDTGFYLVVDYVDGNGEPGKFQTSSRTITAQLVRLWMLDAFPALVKVCKGDKPTRRGFWPLSLQVIAATGGK